MKVTKVIHGINVFVKASRGNDYWIIQGGLVGEARMRRLEMPIFGRAGSGS